MRKASLKLRFWNDGTTGCRLGVRRSDQSHIQTEKRNLGWWYAPLSASCKHLFLVKGFANHHGKKLLKSWWYFLCAVWWWTPCPAGFSQTTQAILIISPDSRKVYNLISLWWILYWFSTTICWCAHGSRTFLTGTKPFLMCLFCLLIDLPNLTRFIWFSETSSKPTQRLTTPLVLPASYRIARFRLICRRLVGKVNKIWFYKRDCLMPCLSKEPQEPPVFSSQIPETSHLYVNCQVDCFCWTSFCGVWLNELNDCLRPNSWYI